MKNVTKTPKNFVKNVIKIEMRNKSENCKSGKN